MRKGLVSPRQAAGVLVALARGRWCVIWCRLRGRRLTVGRNFRVYGRLVVRGPGRVVFGDDVRIGMTVTPWTYSPDAVIEVGSDSFINGTRFGCARSIRVGARAILGQSNLLDTDFHSTRADRHESGAPVRVAPIVIGDNVWIAANAGILPGTTIGANSVVGFGAVCSGEYPGDSVITGNPARVVKPIPGAGDRCLARGPTA